jgi:hypothetical protein
VITFHATSLSLSPKLQNSFATIYSVRSFLVPLRARTRTTTNSRLFISNVMVKKRDRSSQQSSLILILWARENTLKPWSLALSVYISARRLNLAVVIAQSSSFFSILSKITYTKLSECNAH